MNAHIRLVHQPAHLLQLSPGAVEKVLHRHPSPVSGGQVGGADDDVADVAPG